MKKFCVIFSIVFIFMMIIINGGYYIGHGMVSDQNVILSIITSIFVAFILSIIGND